VSRAIVKRQAQFFEHGPLGMKPLALRTIAEDVGIHESTVCRVTNNKYVSTPFGVFELKYFFSRAMTSTAGTEVSGTAIRRLVKEMLDGELESAPLSDAEITRRLAQQGLVLSRRTVTKYRLAMQVGGTRQRRKAAASHV
jgi:RNA polymerase sigma-54 factor